MTQPAVLDATPDEEPTDEELAGLPRDDEDSPVYSLIVAAGLALTALAIAYRDGEADAFAEDASLDLYGRYVDAFLIGEGEWLTDAFDTGAGHAFAQDAVFADGGEIGFLRGFEEDMAGLSDAEIAARADMYGGAAWSAYQAGRVEGAQASGVEVATWVKDDIETSCDDCEELDGQSWPLDEIPSFPGDGSTKCLSDCRCSLKMQAAEQAAGEESSGEEAA
jgi:hypothetical protein